MMDYVKAFFPLNEDIMSSNERELSSFYYYYDDTEITNESQVGFGILIGYFVGCVFCAYVLDVSGLFDPFVRRLGDRAYRSHERDKRYTDALESSASQKRHSLDAKEREELSHVIDNEVDNTLQQKGTPEEKSCFEKCFASCCCCYYCLKRLLWIPDENYSAEFFAKLLTRPVYYGCQDDMIKGGMVLSKGCCTPEVSLPLGCFEDFIFYFINNSVIFSMFLATRGHPYTRRARRTCFMLQNAIAFLLSVIVVSLEFGPKTAVMFNVLVITPITLSVNSFFYYINCPCLQGEDTNCNRFWINFSRMISYPIAWVGIGVLFLASCFFKDRVDPYGKRSLAKFVYSCHVVSTFANTLYIFLLYFTGREYFRVSVCGLPVLHIGRWFYEFAMADGMFTRDPKNKKDNIYTSDILVYRSYGLCKCIEFEYFCPRYKSSFRGKHEALQKTDDDVPLDEDAEDFFHKKHAWNFSQILFISFFGRGTKNLVNKAVIEEADRRSNLEENTEKQQVDTNANGGNSVATALEIDQSAPADVAVQNQV